MATVTLQDIADHLGLAKTTVAGVMRDRPGFNEKTRARVKAAAHKLGYQRNPLGAALAGGRSMSISLLIGSLDPVLLERMHTIETAARTAGYASTVIFAQSRSTPFATADVEPLLQRRVDGIVVHALAPLSAAVRKQLRASGVPCVYMLLSPPTAALRKTDHCVWINRQTGARQAARHLTDLGHREATFVGIHYDKLYPRERLTPFRKAFAAEGVALSKSSPPWIIGDASEADLISQTRDFAYQQFRKGNVPTALVVGDDEAAAAVLAAARDCGLSVPGDLSIIGQDDLPIANVTHPSLTTIREPGQPMGQQAWALLKAALDDPQRSSESIEVGSQLVVRDSTGPARKTKGSRS